MMKQLSHFGINILLHRKGEETFWPHQTKMVENLQTPTKEIFIFNFFKKTFMLQNHLFYFVCLSMCLSWNCNYCKANLNLRISSKTKKGKKTNEWTDGRTNHFVQLVSALTRRVRHKQKSIQTLTNMGKHNTMFVSITHTTRCLKLENLCEHVKCYL